MEKYIVKAYEEEIGERYIEIYVPKGTSREKVFKNFEMASRYATLTEFDEEYDDIRDYDEHLEDMLWYRDMTNGEETFYITLKNIVDIKFVH